MEMARFHFDGEKAINSVLYILEKIEKADYHKIFKILYFADKDHLKKYGRPVTADEYQAMEFGPVPSYIYDIFKAVSKKGNPWFDYEKYAAYFSIEIEHKLPVVKANTKPNLDSLSESDIESLDISIQENKNLSFNELKDKSHDSAWELASNHYDIEMSYKDIAKAAGASDDMLNYIVNHAENSSASLL